MKTNKKIKLIISMAILSYFTSIQQASAQVSTDDLDWYSGNSINSLAQDIWVVNGNDSNYWAALRIQVSNDRAWNMVNQGDLWWGFAANNNDKDQGDEKMRLTADGKLGIGTSDPDGNLHVVGPENDGTTAALMIERTDGGQTMLLDGNEIDAQQGTLYLNNNSAHDIFIGSGGGNVGIGTTASPSARLDVNGTGIFSGNVGIGTTTPSANLHVSGTSQFDGTGYFSANVGIGITNPSAALHVNGASQFDGIGYFDDKVGIGTPTPSEKLDVVGNVKADGVILNIGSFPDYVFESDYPLMPLSKVESYIKANKHLPGFPSEDEVIKDGADLGQLNTLLVEKVEELTLYTIAQEKQIDKLSNELDVLKAQLEILLKKQ